MSEITYFDKLVCSIWLVYVLILFPAFLSCPLLLCCYFSVFSQSKYFDIIFFPFINSHLEELYQFHFKDIFAICYLLIGDDHFSSDFQLLSSFFS